MNKKNIVLSAIVMVGTISSILPKSCFTWQEEQVRRDYICQLSQANALSIGQYFENGKFSNDLIECDIAILEKDSQQAINNKKWAEGYFYSWFVPGSAKLTVVGSGLSALVGTAATVVGSVLAYDVWNNSSLINVTDRFYSPVANVSFNNLPDRIEAYLNYCKVKARYLARQSDYNETVLTAAPALPFIVVGTLISAAIFKYSSKKLAHYKKRNADFIEQMQTRYNCNALAIARLQKIAFEAKKLQ